MKNLGKVFEENWRKSIPEDIFYYRFRDSSGAWSGNNQLRFTPSNIADNMIFYDFKLFLIELKSHKGKSIPLDKIIGNKTKEKQIKDLTEANKFDGIYSSIIVFFSDLEKCYELPIDEFNEFLEKEDRKSIPVEYFQQRGFEIEAQKLKTNYRFNVVKWLKEF